MVKAHQAGSIFRSSESYSETRDRGTERQGLVYSAQWRNPYNLGTNLGYQSAVNYKLIVIKETKGYVCDETRQSIDGSPELFRVVDQQRYEKDSSFRANKPLQELASLMFLS